MNRINLIWGLLLILTLSMFSCQSDSTPDVSHINIELEWIDYADKLFTIDTNEIEPKVEELLKEYPSFTPLYCNQILKLPTPLNSPEAIASFKMMIGDSTINNLYQKSKLSNQSKSKIQSELTQALQFYKYYFPNEEIPRFYTLISEYAYGNFIFQDTDKDGIGIGLDFYLGEDYPYLDLNPGNPSFSQYLTRTFNKDHLVKKTIEVLVDDKIGVTKGSRFIDHIIHNGKKLYVLKQLLPTVSDTIIHEYTAEQLDWCEKNQSQIWAHFFSEDLMYSTRLHDFNKLINPSPNSSKMPAEAPGRTGNFMGFKIVEAYMDRTGNTIKQLLSISDAQKILTDSRFKPKID